MFGPFKTKKADVIRHWYALIPNFTNSSNEFYESVEQELKARQVPGLELSRVDFSEGGLLSDKRTYLRMIRERLVFDVCAAPFGTSYFFSLRFAEIPAVVQLWEILVLVSVLSFAGLVSFLIFIKIFGILGPFLWPFSWIAFFFLAIYAMRNAARNSGPKDLDTMLLRIPVISAIYEAWFRRETYYRQDTRLMYCDTVDEVVKAKVEEVTGAKGVKLLRFNDFNPVLGDLYKPTIVKPPGAPPT